MDAANDLALKSVGKRRAETFDQLFFQATSEMKKEDTYYLLMLGEKNKTAKWQTDDTYFWQSFAPFESMFPSKIQIFICLQQSLYELQQADEDELLQVGSLGASSDTLMY